MTEEEKRQYMSNIYYFWHEKGDIERFCDFSIERLREVNPALADSYIHYKQAEKAFIADLDDAAGEY